MSEHGILYAESSHLDSSEDDDSAWETDEDSAIEKSSMKNPLTMKVGPTGRDKGSSLSVQAGKQIDKPPPRGTEPNELFLAHMSFLRGSAMTREKKKKESVAPPTGDRRLTRLCSKSN